MKLRNILVFFLFLFSFTEVYSTHLVGGYASYEYLGRVGTTNNYRYRVLFTVYRDCKSNVDFDETITVCIFDENTRNIFKSETINKGITRSVDPVGNTDCPQSKAACIEVNVYEKIITLPQSSFGYRIKWERCCRNTQVNLPDGEQGGITQPSQGQTYMVTIPPTSIVNSSPVFTEVPVPFICLNDTTQIRSFATDPDGDSLVFRFVRPWAGGDLNSAIPSCGAQPFNPTLINYRNNNFSENQPFGPGGVSSINAQTGTMTVMATQLGNFALAVDVEEYRNGILIGKVRLDIQLLVINCPPNKTPYLSTASKIFNREVLAGAQLCFNITALDDDNQNVKITGFGEIFTGGPGWSGPTATFPSSQGFKQTTSQFCWTPSCDQARGAPYVFVVEAIDDGCPSKFLNETYYITVRPFKSNMFITGNNPVCEGLYGTKYRVNNTVAGSTIQWTVEGGIIVAGIGTNEITVDWDYSKASGKIIANEVSANGCTDVPKTFDVTFLPRPPAPQIISVDSVCLGDEIQFSTNLPNMSYRWLMPSGAVLSTPSVSIVTDNVGTFIIRHLVIDLNQCPSDTAEKPFVVVEPQASEIIGPKTVCPNNSDIEFWVEGYPGSSFTWFVENATIMRGQGTDTVVLAFGEPTIAKIKVVETTPLGCVGDTLYIEVDVTYDLIIEEPIGDRSVCEYTERYIAIPQPYVNNTIYYWTVEGGQIDEITPKYSIYINWGEAGIGKIRYYQTAYDTLNSKACVSNTVEIDVILRPIPTAEFIEGVFEVCQFTDSMTFTLNGFDSSTYYWEVNGNTNLLGQGSNTIKYPTNIADTFAIRVLEISQYGCPGETIDSQFIIHPKPVTTPIVGDSILCHPDFSNRTYTVQGFETSTFHWSVNGGQRRDSLLIPSTTIDWFGDQNNSISLYEVSSFGCIGDTLRYQVFIDSPAIDIIVLTVSPPPGNDRRLIVNWELINAPRYDTTFSIYKRTVLPETDFTKIGEIAGNIFTFTESNVNTKITPFDFQIKGHDLCRNEVVSPIHTSILLTGEKPEEYTVEMNFTDYLGWHSGVMDYVVKRSLLNKTPFQEYDREISPIRLYYENGIDHYTQCYRIKANEQEGRFEESWSNEICFNFPPLMFIPNAFSPNGNNLNDMFGVSAAAIKTFKMTLFNRWGEQLFVTNDFNVSWDGTFMGTPCEQGVYMFIVEYTSFDDTPYRTKGTFHLLR